jgi:hypothetical protein
MIGQHREKNRVEAAFGAFSLVLIFAASFFKNIEFTKPIKNSIWEKEK